MQFRFSDVSVVPKYFEPKEEGSNFLANLSFRHGTMHMTFNYMINTRLYPKVSGLAAWSENFK